MPAHAWVDRYDVSDASTPPANLAGVRDETGWMACARNNLTIVLGSPARTSYVQPTLPTFVTEQLAFVAPSNATTGEAVMHLTDTLIPNATNDALVAAGAFPQAAFDPPGSDVNGRERLTLDTGEMQLAVSAPFVDPEAIVLADVCVHAALHSDHVRPTGSDKVAGQFALPVAELRQAAQQVRAAATGLAPEVDEALGTRAAGDFAQRLQRGTVAAGNEVVQRRRGRRRQLQ